MKKFISIIMSLSVTSCGGDSIAGKFNLAGDTDQKATLALKEKQEFKFCWNGCVGGHFKILHVNDDRGRLELSGNNVGRKFKNMISSSHSKNFASVPAEDVGYKNDDYIDVDVIKGFLGNKIYIFTEPDIYFEES